MSVRRLAPFLILIIFILAIFQIGCDTLVTENNTIIRYDSTIAVDCFSCHNDNNNDLIRPKEQFANSAHANHDLLDVEIFDKPCVNCHTHEGYLNAFDTSQTFSVTAYNTINCFTCHLPHTGEYAEWKIDTIRASDSTLSYVQTQSGVRLGDDLGISNNCGHCHSATDTIPGGDPVVLTDNFGPHFSPQADVVSGKNGYFLDLTTFSNHRHKDNGCIKCHYYAYGEGQGYTFAEHTFRLEDKQTGEQFVKTCNQATCHTSMDNFYTNDTMVTIDTLGKTVQALLTSFNILDSTDTSGMTIIPGNIPVIEAKALYNYLLYKHDGSRGIHNVKFITNLLDTTANILDSLPPITSFTSDNTLGCVGETFTFTPSIIGKFNLITWDFGNDSSFFTLDDSPVSMTYNNTGIYNITMITLSGWTSDSLNGSDTVYVDTFASDTVTMTNYITVDTIPIADFIASNTSICLGDTITFSSTSSNIAPGTYKWDFGDGTTQTTGNTDYDYIYDTLGIFDVSMIVETQCGADTAIKLGYITVDGLVPVISYVNNGNNDYTFTDNTVGTVTSREWDFDNDGTIDDTNISASFTYTADTVLTAYWAKLYVTHETCGVYTDSVQIVVPAQ